MVHVDPCRPLPHNQTRCGQVLMCQLRGPPQFPVPFDGLCGGICCCVFTLARDNDIYRRVLRLTPGLLPLAGAGSILPLTKFDSAIAALLFDVRVRGDNTRLAITCQELLESIEGAQIGIDRMRTAWE